MNVAEILALDRGSAFRRVDLHVHTPGSTDTDHNWREVGPDDLVRLAIAAGLDAIAVTDHNSVEWCDAVREAANGSLLTVFPGVEISTRDGHLLAIFDPGADIQLIRDLLVISGIATGRFGDLEALANDGIDAIARRVVDAGGIAIAAHVDKEKGFWSLTKQTGVRRQQIHQCEEIQAFEVYDELLAPGFLNGAIEGYERKVACVQGSDCYEQGGDGHRIDAVGRRSTFLKLGTFTARALRQALLDPLIRVRLASDQISEPSWCIEALAVTGGFLDGAVFRFSDDMTCLVGGTGVGKSLCIELVRFVLGQQVEAQLGLIAAEVQARLEETLADGSVVRLFVRRGSDRYVVGRMWQGAEPADPIVYRVELSGSLEPARSIHLPSFLPITAFSQGEVIEYARQLPARLRLIDELIDLSEPRNQIGEIESKLRENSRSLLERQRRIESTLDEILPLPGIREEIERLERFFKDDMVRAQRLWRFEDDTLAAAEGRFEEARVGLATLADLPHALLAQQGEIPDDGAPNPDVLMRLRDISQLYADGVSSYRAAFENVLEGISGQMNDLRQEWDHRYQAWRQDFDRRLLELGDDGAGLPSLHGKLERLRSQEADLARKDQAVTERLRPDLNALEEQRSGLVGALLEARNRVRDARRTKASELTTRLGGRVRVRIDRFGDTRESFARLRELRVGSKISDSDIQRMAEKLHPALFVPTLLGRDFETLAEKSGLPESHFERLLEALLDRDRREDWLEFQLVNPEDVVRVQFAAEGDRYKELESLAHGQKCTVVLMIAMAEGDWPILVDQPEDALHAPWIEENIVSRLREDRGSRQYIFATKSPGILVSADSEQVIALASEAEKGWIDKTGSIDDFDSRDMIVYHVEGGEGPLARRHVKYDLR